MDDEDDEGQSQPPPPSHWRHPVASFVWLRLLSLAGFLGYLFQLNPRNELLLEVSSTRDNEISQSSPQTGPIPIIVPKNGRSGSTWFASLFDVNPICCVEHEVVTKQNVSFDTTEKLKRVKNAFQEFEARGDQCSMLHELTACPVLPDRSRQPDFHFVMNKMWA